MVLPPVGVELYTIVPPKLEGASVPAAEDHSVACSSYWGGTTSSRVEELGHRVSEDRFHKSVILQPFR